MQTIRASLILGAQLAPSLKVVWSAYFMISGRACSDQSECIELGCGIFAFAWLVMGGLVCA